MLPLSPRAIKTLCYQFCKNQSGGFAVWVGLTAPVLLGTAALSVDAARVYNLDQELQSAADALARAGAAELDFRNDSISRANRAINNLVRNKQKFGNAGAGQVDAGSVRFLKDLPDNDYDPVTNALVTSDPKKAKFVEVTVKPETATMFFPQGWIKSVTSVTLEAKATAGTEQGVCGVAPIFVCNPYEGTETSLYEAMETRAFQRRLVQFKTPKKKYGPGNFGYLDPFDGGGGASAIADAIAIDVPPVCFSKSAGVTLRPGNISSMRHAINTRFDMYKGSFKKKKTNVSYAPAANVVRGYSGQVCKEKPDTNAMGLPRDACFADGSCTEIDGRMGNGNWDFLEYMRVNHKGMKYITIDGTQYYLDYDNDRVSPPDLPTRYAMYRWEIENNCIPGDLTYGNASTPEEGIPLCHTHGASQADIDRRIIYAAVLNCAEIEESDLGMNGRKSGIPVETFVKVFLTEPMGKGQDNAIWGEIVGPVVEGQDSVARDKVSVSR